MKRVSYHIYAKAVIYKGGKVLLGKKRKGGNHPLSGQWHFFGGAVEKNENPFDAIKREIKEEAGFACDIINGKPKPMSDIDELEWVPVNSLKKYLRTDNPIPQRVLRFLSS